MKAIVTGAAGFIGSHVCRELEKRGDLFTGIDNMSSGSENNCQSGSAGSYYIYADVESCLSEMIQWKPDVIFHLAAIPRVSYSVEHPYETTKSNILSMLAVLDAARETKARVVYSSSSSIYGGATTLPTPENYYASPQSPYAMQKWQCEEWARLYSSLYDVDVCCLRYFNAFGTHSRYGGPYTTVIGAWMYSLFIDPEVKPYLEGDGTQTRDFCYVDNIVQANMLAAEYKDKFDGEAFNISHGSRHSLLDIWGMLEDMAGKKLGMEMRPPRIGDVDHTLADISKAQKVLGYNPVDDFEGQMAIMAEWYKTDYRKEIEETNA